MIDTELNQGEAELYLSSVGKNKKRVPVSKRLAGEEESYVKRRAAIISVVTKEVRAILSYSYPRDMVLRIVRDNMPVEVFDTLVIDDYMEIEILAFGIVDQHFNRVPLPA